MWCDFSFDIRIYFPERVAKERGLTNLHNGGKCRARYFGYDNFVVKKMQIFQNFFLRILVILNLGVRP